MKVLMRALGKLQNQIFGRRPSKSLRKTLRPSEKPKNGLLILGVLITIAIMVGLTIFNLRLIRDQVCANKQSVEESIPKKIVTIVPEHAAVDSKPEDKPSHPNTEVTFYKQLKCEDDGKSPITRLTNPSSRTRGTKVQQKTMGGRSQRPQKMNQASLSRLYQVKPAPYPQKQI